jgi:hypothetical protein
MVATEKAAKGPKKEMSSNGSKESTFYANWADGPTAPIKK